MIQHIQITNGYSPNIIEQIKNVLTKLFGKNNITFTEQDISNITIENNITINKYLIKYIERSLNCKIKINYKETQEPSNDLIISEQTLQGDINNDATTPEVPLSYFIDELFKQLNNL